jgi:hypothetical protein
MEGGIGLWPGVPRLAPGACMVRATAVPNAIGILPSRRDYQFRIMLPLSATSNSGR